jgi:sulfur carrier protein
MTVADFIRSRDLDPRYVVVERNGEALERARYAEVRLAEGDRLELVRAVAGG